MARLWSVLIESCYCRDEHNVGKDKNTNERKGREDVTH